MKTKILKISCRFCGTVEGQMEVNDYRAEYEWQITNAKAQIENRMKALDALNPSSMTPVQFAEEKMKSEAYVKTQQELVTDYSQRLSNLPATDPRHDIDFHIQDHRCKKCEAEHGNLSEMSERANRHGFSREEFKEIMDKSGWSKKKFDEHIINHERKNK